MTGGLELPVGGQRDGPGIHEVLRMRPAGNLRVDPLERVNLMAYPVGERRVGSFRRMLLKVLTENRGSVEVEEACLEPYRKWLESLVQGRSEPIATTAAN